MVTIYIPDIPEFLPLINAVKESATGTVREPVKGYWQLSAEKEISLHRKALGLGPALWNSALTGGFRGTITDYDRHVLRIVDSV